MSRHYKGDHILSLYLRMMDGEHIQKLNYSLEEGVTPRTFDRDIQTLRNCLSERYLGEEVVYDKARDTYYISSPSKVEGLSFEEGYLLLTALMQEQILRNDEIAKLKDSVISSIQGMGKKELQELLQEDVLRYTSPSHGQALMKIIGDLLLVIRRKQKILLQYDLGEGRQELEVLPLNLEHGEHKIYLSFAIGEDHHGALIEIEKIYSFLPLSAYFLVDKKMKIIQEKMRVAVQGGSVAKYRIKEMVSDGST